MRGPPSPFLDGRDLAEVYVEPDVLVAEARSPGEREEPDGDLVRAMSPEVTDPDEDPVRRHRERRMAWPQVLSELGAGAHRAVVLEGPPGGGKSTMLAMAARDIARRSAAALRGGASPAQVELPLLVHLPDLVVNPGDAVAALGATIGAAVAGHAPERRSWLLLDALDEVTDAEEVARLARLLGEVAGWACRVVMATRPAGRLAAMPFAPHLEARTAPLTSTQVEAFIDLRGGRGAERVRRAIMGGGPLAELVENPFLLTVACWVADHGDLPEEPTRTALYHRLVGDLLAQRDWRPTDLARRNAWLPALGEVALALLERRHSLARVPHAELCELLARGNRRPLPVGPEARSASLPLQQAELLTRELETKRLLAPISAHRDVWAAPHRSILEFAAGLGLARALFVDEEAWDLADGLAWEARADETMTFCAGALAGECGDALADADRVGRLLGLLADEERDNFLRHRLALAARCLAEIPGPGLATISAIVDRITTEAFSLWWSFGQREIGAAILHLDAAMPALAFANGRIGSTRLLDHVAAARAWTEKERLLALEAVRCIGPTAATPRILVTLCGLLADDERRVRLAAVEAVGGLGSPAATPEVLDRLCSLLTDDDSDIRRAAATAVGGLGPAAATPEFLDRLGVLLASGDPNVRWAAARAVGKLGPAATAPEVLDRLGDLLGDDDWSVRWETATAVGGLGPAAATPEFLDRLGVLLASGDANVGSAAAEAVGKLGPAAATPDFFDRLGVLLASGDPNVRSAAAEAVGGLGPPAATPDFIVRLGDLLGDDDWPVRRAAAEAVGRLGPTAASPEVLDRLGVLLASCDWYAMRAATDAIGRLGQAAATPEIFDRLGDLLGDDDWNVRRDTAEAVGRLGPAATQVLLDRLGDLLADDDDRVREVAAKAVGRLGPAAATSEFLDRLVGLLGDDDPAVRACAATAVGELGPAAATPVVLDRLGGLLDDDEPDVRGWAAAAIGRLGPAAATPEFLDRLGDLLADIEVFVQGSAAEAVGLLGPAAATPEFLERLGGLLGDDEPEVREWATVAVGELGPVAATPVLLERLGDLLTDHYNQQSAATAVGELGPAAATPVLLERLRDLLGHRDSDARRAAAAAVGGLGPAAATPEIVGRLGGLLDDEDPYVRREAATALGGLGPAMTSRAFLARPTASRFRRPRDVKGRTRRL